MPPAIPNYAFEEAWRSPVAERAKRNADRLVRSYEGVKDDWLAKIRRLKLEAEAADVEPFALEERAMFDALIEDFEDYAEYRTRQSVRLEKKARRDVKRQFARDPSLAAVAREFSTRLVAIDHDIIEAILDYALFLRAFRSERIPEARGGAVFDDPEQLARFLDAETA